MDILGCVEEVVLQYQKLINLENSPNKPQFETQGFDQEFDHCENPPNYFTVFVQDDVNQIEDIEVHGDDLIDSDYSDFLLDEDNIIDKFDIDMKDFFLNIDQNVEWMGDNGRSSVNVEDGKEDEEIEGLNNDNTDEGGIKVEESQLKQYERHKKIVKRVLLIHFICIRLLVRLKSWKNRIKQHAFETRIETEIIKNDKNNVRAFCKGGIPYLICNARRSGLVN
uniref:Uncharacterized protein n=1 Tax=Lactuca sativa TaxID=4236 RepID=A0A9R1XSG2_LACSA|nr:hypothetical protein LSAT_V11C200082390 [Lactuca sativa]